jgi:hypothetical protein
MAYMEWREWRGGNTLQVLLDVGQMAQRQQGKMALVGVTARS